MRRFFGLGLKHYTRRDTNDTRCDTSDTSDTRCDTSDTRCDTSDTRCDTSDTRCDTSETEIFFPILPNFTSDALSSTYKVFCF